MARSFNASAILRANSVDCKQNESLLKAHHQSSFRSDILSRYSSNREVLASEDARKWLSKFTPDGSVSEDELHWVVMLGNIRSKNEKRFRGCSRNLDVKSAVIFPDTFDLIIQAWVAYVKNKPSIESIFKRFDVDRNGSLSRGEVVDFLTSLNNGTPPTPEEVDWVFKSSDVIGAEEGIETPEVLQLLSAWYSRPSLQLADNVDDKAEDKQFSQALVPAVAPNNACGQCVVQ
jgi:Ca2+-binding EF-hand superfamily protein